MGHTIIIAWACNSEVMLVVHVRVRDGVTVVIQSSSIWVSYHGMSSPVRVLCAEVH